MSTDHDLRLASQVRPPDWTNPTPRDRYNLAVLGGGTAGLVAAAACAGLGGRVALVERKALGGDCLNSGCIPSKTFIAAARTAHTVRQASDYGIDVGGDSLRSDDPRGLPGVDFGRVMERVRAVRADIAAHDSAARFTKLGVDIFFGEGRFVDRTSIQVGDIQLRFARALIATGSRPIAPSIPGLSESGFLTSDSILQLPSLPARLAVIGAGAIGCEYAQAFARLGSEVTIIELEPSLLPLEDPLAASVVERSMRRDGIRVLTGSRVEAVSIGSDGEKRIEWSNIGPDGAQRIEEARSGPDGAERIARSSIGLEGAERIERSSIAAERAHQGDPASASERRAEYDPPSGEKKGAHGGTLVVDEILVSAGRQPNLEALGLEKAGIAVSYGRLVVGGDLRTTNRRVFAAGDVATEARFTHSADAMARIVIRNALFLGRARYDPGTIPSCVFTDPELAHIGLRAYDDEVRTTVRVPFEDVDRVRTDDVRRIASEQARDRGTGGTTGGAGVRIGESVERLDSAGDADQTSAPDWSDAGFAAVHLGRGDRIVGATIVGVGAGETIGLFAQAMASGVGLGSLSDLVLPYPTRGLIVRALGDAYQRSRLTPTISKIIRAWIDRTRRG